jgi:hypothetical protein
MPFFHRKETAGRWAGLNDLAGLWIGWLRCVRKKRQQSRADVRLVIETLLDELPRTYTRQIYAQKCDLVYQHVFESYQDGQHSVYAEAG